MLDTSIPLGVKNIQFPDIAAAQQNRLQNQNLRKQGKMSDLLLANAQRDEAKAVEADKKARTMQGLLQVNTEIGQDGRPTLNKQRMVGDLNRLGFASEALDMQKATEAEAKAARDAKRSEYKERLGLRERVLADHSPENYAGKLSLLKSFGDDLEDLPPQYNPDAVNNSLKQVMTLKERMEQSGKESDRKDAQSKQTAQEKKDAAAALLAEGNAKETKRHNMATEGIQRTAANKEKTPPGTAKLTPAQAGTLADISEAQGMLNNLAQSFNKNGMAKSPGKAYAADVVESIPIIGGKLAPKTAEFNDNKRITAEKFLRAATGAAAPKSEVKFYASLLPEAGDSPAQAQSAMNSFRAAVKAKALGVPSALRLEGREAEAQAVEARIEQLFAEGSDIDQPGKAPAAPKATGAGALMPKADGSFDYVPGGH